MSRSQPSGLCGKKSLANLGLLTLLVALLSSCYHNPYAFQSRRDEYRAHNQGQLPATFQPATGRQKVAYSNNSQAVGYTSAPNYYQQPQTSVGGQQGDYNSVAQAPTASYQPGYPYAAAPMVQRAQFKPVDNRWNSGNDWNTRKLGVRVNPRGAGNLWRNRTTPTPPDSQTWQSVSTYPTANTTYSSQPGYQQSQNPGVRLGAGGSAFGVNAGGSSATHTVVAGDNLSTIADTYGCSLNELKSVNNLFSDIIQPGQQLNIPR